MNARALTPLFSKRACVGILLVCLVALFSSRPLTPQSPPQFVYTADESTHMISAFVLNPTTGALTPVPGSPFNERLDPYALAVDPAGKFLFVANNSTSDVSVFAINQMSGALTEAPNSPYAGGMGFNPTVLTTDVSGKFLFVGNTHFHDVGGSSGEVDVYSIDPVTGVLTPSPNSLTAFAAIGPSTPVGIFAHPGGKCLYVMGLTLPDQPESDVVEQYPIDPTTGELSGGVCGGAIYNGPEQARSLGATPTGAFLYVGAGKNVGVIETFAVSPVDGSLNQVDVLSLQPPFSNSITVDLSAKYLFSTSGTYLIDPMTGSLTLTPNNSNLRSLGPNPQVADRIGEFLFTGDPGKKNAILNSFRIDTTSGLLTPAPGSPYTTTAVVQAIAVTGSPVVTPAPAANFSPTAVSFSSQLVGVPSALQMIQLFNTGTATLNIASIAITGANIGDFSQTNDCAATLSGGAHCTFTVIFTPGDAGSRSAAITVMDNASGSPHSAALTGTGVSDTPMAALTPATFTFAATTVGNSSASQAFNLMNSGTGALAISSIGFTGPNPGDFTQSNTCGSSVPANMSCTITVTFSPQAVGLRTAILSVSDNAAGSPHTAALSGTGNAPFMLAASGPTTATAKPGGTATYSLQFSPIANFTGTVTLSCTSTPAGVPCSASPSTIQVKGSAAVPVTVIAMPPAKALLVPSVRFTPLGSTSLRLTSGMVCSLSLVGIVLARKRRTKRVGFAPRFVHAALASLLLALCLTAACGGGGSGTPPTPSNFTLTVTASSGGAVLPVTLNLTVQ